MGSKKLKAVAVRGTVVPEVADEEGFKELSKVDARPLEGKERRPARYRYRWRLGGSARAGRASHPQLSGWSVFRRQQDRRRDDAGHDSN